MFHFIDINNFIHLSGCVGMGPTALLFPEAYNAVKAACSKYRSDTYCQTNAFNFYEVLYVFVVKMKMTK